MGEVFYRFAASYALSMIQPSTYENFFLPHQYGVRIPGGCEIVIHSLQQRLSNPYKPRFLLSIDMKNAFNCLDRGFMMNSLFESQEFSALYRLAHWCYKAPTPLIIKNKDGIL